MNTLEKEDIIDVEEDFSTTKSILRNRKRTTDSKELLLFLNIILQPLHEKPLNIIRTFSRDIRKHLYQAGEWIETNTATHPLESTWLILQGKVVLYDYNEKQSFELSEGHSFSSHICAYKEHLSQPDNFNQFTIKAKSNCILLSIQNSKISKLYEIDEVQQQLQKRTLICKALNLHTVGVTIKSFVKKFVLRKVNKSTILVNQDHKQQTLFIVAKGDIQLTKLCRNEVGQKVKVRIGIVSQINFVNDYSFFKQAQIGSSKYTVQAMTQAQIYTLSKTQLFKYFYDLPTLWPNIALVCEQKHKTREKLIKKHLEKRQQQIIQKPLTQLVYTVNKKQLRKQTIAVYQDFITQAAKFQQMINSKEKVAKPLMQRSMNSTTKKCYNLQAAEIKKLIKKQKMDVMKVRSLVDNRIIGIRSDEVIVKLKPTLFNDRTYFSEIQPTLQIPPRAVYTPTTCASSRLKTRKNLSIRGSTQNIRNTTFDNARRSLTAKVNNRPKKFRMVAPPRQHYQSSINRSSDPYIFTRCETGKTRKIRAVF